MKLAEAIISVLSLIAVIVLMGFYIKHKKSQGLKGKESVYAGIWWLCIFIFGLALQLIYFVGVVHKTAGAGLGDYLTAIALSCATTIRMFGFDFKTDAVKALNDGSVLGKFYTVALIVVFFCAGLWTYLMLIKNFFKGAVNSIGVFFKAHPMPWRKNKTHYIVVGSGKPVEIFIKSLGSKKDVTIITGQPGGDKKAAETAYKSFLEKGYTVICGKLSDAALKRAGYANQKRKTIIIAMSDDDEENVFTAELVTHEVYNRIFSEGIDYSNDNKFDEAVFRQEAITASSFSDNMTLEKINKLHAEIIANEAQKDKKDSPRDILIIKFYALMSVRKEKIDLKSIDIKAGKNGEIIFEYFTQKRNNAQIYKRSKSFSPQKSVHNGVEYIERTPFQVLEDRLAEAIEQINIDARIMYSFIERAEHFAFAQNAYGKVRFFNPYELRVRDFFWQNPVTSLVADLIAKPDSDEEQWLGRLKGSFDDELRLKKQDGKGYDIKNIFVGFGAANMQMLRGSIQTGQLLGVDYSAVVFDRNVADYDPKTEQLSDLLKKSLSPNQARLVNHCSGLFKGGDECEADKAYFSSPKESYNICFEKSDVLSRSFYNSLRGKIKNADFTSVFIALGDDKFAIETALEIRQSILENGIDHTKVKIFVKIKERSSLNRETAIRNSGDKSEIICYGADDEVFTFDQIVCEGFDNLTIAITNKNHGEPWAFLNEARREINRQAALAAKTKLQLIGFDFISNDELLPNYNREQSWGLYQKRYGIDEKNNPETVAVIDHIEDKSKKIHYPYPHKDGKIADNARNNLARLEHLRWNTFYLLNGWTKLPIECIGGGSGTRKNDKTKQHACITTFEDLIKLRQLQAEKASGKKPDDNVLGSADTIWYDFSLMDELVRPRKRVGGMNPLPPRITHATYSIICTEKPRCRYHRQSSNKKL